MTNSYRVDWTDTHGRRCQANFIRKCMAIRFVRDIEADGAYHRDKPVMTQMRWLWDDAVGWYSRPVQMVSV